MNLKIKKIYNELQNYKRPKNTLLIYYIEKRLNKSLYTYMNDVNNSYAYIKNNTLSNKKLDKLL